MFAALVGLLLTAMACDQQPQTPPPKPPKPVAERINARADATEGSHARI
jgi:hypothetical protein